MGARERIRVLAAYTAVPGDKHTCTEDQARDPPQDGAIAAYVSGIMQGFPVHATCLSPLQLQFWASSQATG